MSHYKITMNEIEHNLKRADNVQKILNHRFNNYYQSIEEIMDLHFELSNILMYLTSDSEFDGERFPELTKLSAILNHVEYDYHEIVNNKKALESGITRA